MIDLKTTQLKVGLVIQEDTGDEIKYYKITTAGDETNLYESKATPGTIVNGTFNPEKDGDNVVDDRTFTKTDFDQAEITVVDPQPLTMNGGRRKYSGGKKSAKKRGGKKHAKKSRRYSGGRVKNVSGGGKRVSGGGKRMSSS